MSTHVIDETSHYIGELTELLALKNIRIGRMKPGRMSIHGRWAGCNALEIMGSALEKAARMRGGKRYLDPLPVCAPCSFAGHRDRRPPSRNIGREISAREISETPTFRDG